MSASHSDTYTSYEIGLQQLLLKLGASHPAHAEALTYQQRLLENISSARRYGDTETRRAERAEIISLANMLALSSLGITLNDLSGSAESSDRRSSYRSSPDIPRCPHYDDLPRLRQILGQYFSDSELRDLTFDLGIDYENIPGNTKTDKAREVILYLQRQKRLQELISWITSQRPDVDL